MLQIRDAQMYVFEEAARSNYARRSVASLCRLFPKKSAEISPEGLTRFVRISSSRAEELGLTGQRELFFFISLMFGLGVDYVGRGEPSWVAEMLKRPEFARMANLEEVRLRILREMRRRR
jgi:hypothetical protein